MWSKFALIVLPLQVRALCPVWPHFPHFLLDRVDEVGGGVGVVGGDIDVDLQESSETYPGSGHGQTMSRVSGEQNSLILLNRYHLRSRERPCGRNPSGKLIKAWFPWFSSDDHFLLFTIDCLLHNNFPLFGLWKMEVVHLLNLRHNIQVVKKFSPVIHGDHNFTSLSAN